MKTSGYPKISRIVQLACAGLFALCLAQQSHGAGATTPFVSYEAESGTPGGGATIVSLTTMPTTQYSSPELEASGHAYVRLAATGQYVEWTNNTGKNINGINVRASIPDSATGGGITATLDIYVNGAFRQALTLNSKQSWLYEGGTNNYNGNNQNPADGNPRVFFDEMHTTITGAAIAPGSTIRLQKNAANTAAFYHIDVVDLEALPAALSQPANSLSITSYGAVSYNTGFDNSTAIQNCINAAKSQGKSVWIPQGVFYFKSLGGFTATGVTIQGAGMWYSTIYRNLPLPNSTPLGAVFNITSCTLRNFAIDTNATSRASVDGCGGGMDTSGTNWLTENIWVQHTMSGLWASGNGGTVRNCRLTSIWADGINLNNVSLNAGIGTNLTSTNNFIRGTGDDAHAINSVDYNDFGSGRTYYTRMSNITVTNNTSIAMWGGKGQAIYGGLNQVVKDNYMSDTARYVGLGVGKFNANGSNLESATVTGNVVVRCGGNAYLQQQPAMMIGNGGDGQGTGTVSNVFAGGNTITNAQYDAMAISSSSNIVVQYNTINSPRFDGIVISPPNYDALTGSGMFRQNTVTGLSTGAMVLVNESNGYTVISPLAAASYNSMLGVTAETCAEGGQDLGYINGSDWTAYNNMNLTGVTKFAARIASAGSGGNIEVRLDSPTGTLVGTCTVPVTGGWQTYQNVYCNVSGVSGTRNVYLVYTGGSGFLFNIQCFALYTETIRRLVPGKTVTLNAAVNNLYVCADSAGTKPLIANRTSGGLWESYLVVDAGNGNIALRALANNLYVCADSAGASPLIANRTSYGAWETFREVDAGSGKIAIRALNNNQYVSAPNAGTSPLVASQTSIGLAESFTVGVR